MPRTLPKLIGLSGSIAAVALFLALATGASARHHHRTSAAAAGAFDYYLLSLSWSPAFCLQKPGSPECTGPRRFGFIVHGLWPQNEQGWPENCAPGSQVPDAVAQSVADLMPASALVRHEWSTHGTCSGLEPADFFALVRRAYESVRIPPDMIHAAGPIERSPADITGDFMHANPRLPPQSVVATCGTQGAPRLREMHVCFTRELVPRACSLQALREACRAASVIVPPIR